MALSPNEFAQLLKSNECETLVTKLADAYTGMSKEEIFENLSKFDGVCEGWAEPFTVTHDFWGPFHLSPIKNRLAGALYAYANYSALEKKAEEDGMVMKEDRDHYKFVAIMTLETLEEISVE